MGYSSIAFSEASKKLQEDAGSRQNYARMAMHESNDFLTNGEAEFIASQDSFYMATVGENGFPYIQFRGGPKGFLKVLDSRTLGFVDFKGNMQFISVGNLSTNNKVALILLDYPAKARLKIFAEAELVELKDNPELFKRLSPEDYKFRPERMLVLHIKAFNWNCPQHITPKYTLEEIQEAFASQQAYIAQLEQKIKELKKV